MALLEESRARADLVRDAAAGELDLELERLVVGAVEDRELLELLPLVVPLEQALRRKARLVGDVRQRHDRGQPAALARRPQLLGKLALVVRDRGVGEGEDLGRRAVVARQPERLRLGVALREPEDVLERGAAERVDRLGVVADDRDVLLDPRHPVHDVALQAVGVLVLVHEDVVVGGVQLRRGLGHLVEQPLPHQEQVVVVAGVAQALALAVALEDRDDLRLDLGKVRRVLGEDLGERAARVDRVRVQVEQDVTLGESPLERRDLLVRGRGLEHLAGVLGIEDREVRPEAEAAAEPAQQPVADRVERAAHQPPHVHGQQRLDAAQHLARGPVREGQQQDPGGIVPGLDEARNPVDEGPGLARAGPGDDEDGAGSLEDDLALLVVQLPVVVDAVARQPRGGPEDVFALHGPSLAPPEGGNLSGRALV